MCTEAVGLGGDTEELAEALQRIWLMPALTCHGIAVHNADSNHEVRNCPFSQ